MNKVKYINFLLALLLLSSCSLTRELKEGEHLVYEVEVTGVEQNNEEDIKELIIQTPNTRVPIINFSPGVFIYNLGQISYDSSRLVRKKEKILNDLQEVEAKLNQEPQKNKWHRKYNRLNSRIEGLNKKLDYGNWFMRTGNPKIIYDSSKTFQSQEQIRFYLENHGNFDAKVTTQIKKKKKKAFITYKVDEGNPYVIDSTFTRSGDENIYKLLDEYEENTLIREGHIYNQENLRQERQRVEDVLKNNGYYTFSKSYIAYNVYKDTLENKVTIEQVIRKPIYAEKHKVYRLDSILFSIDSPSALILDEEVNFQHEGITFEMYQDRYSEKILDSRIFLKKGALYNRSEVLETQRQLANLDIFRFVNIAFDTLGNSITAKV